MDIEYLKKRKKEMGMSFDELAEKSGIPKTTLTNIFGGHTTSPRIDTMEAIERALGINEKNPIMERPLSDIAENFMREFGELFSDETFQSYARLYKLMDARQRIFVLGMIVGWLKDQGITVKNL